MPKQTATELPSNVWIFQGNPDVFDLDAYLAEGSGRLTWEVNQNADRINDGDTVYLWRAVSRAVRARANALADKPFSRAARQARLAARPAIVAVARVVGSVFDGPDDSDAVQFRHDLALPETRRRVWLDILANANGREAIRREWLASDPLCNSLPILDRCGDTNIPVTTAQAERLNALWENSGRPMTRKDLLAILSCYCRVRAIESRSSGKALRESAGTTRAAGKASAGPDRQSRLEIDQAIADTAVLVGRAIGGVKLAIAKFRALDPAYPGNGLSGATSVFHDVINQYLDSSRGCLDDAAVERDFANIWLGRSDSGLLL